MKRTASLLTGSLAAAAVAIGAYALWSASVPAPAVAQGGAIDTVLYEQVSQLQTRIQLLENQWQQRSTIPGPFHVIDDAGQELVRIQRDAGGLPQLRIGSGIGLGYIDGGPAVQVQNGGQNATMRIAGSTAELSASADNVNGFFARSSTSGEHLIKIVSGGEEAANLGVMPGRRAAVRLFNDQGDVLAALGIDTSGIGQLRVTDPDTTSGVTAGGDGSSGGSVVLWRSGQEVASMRSVSGVGTLSIYNNGGKPVGFATTTSEGAGLVTINDSTGNEVVHFTVRGPGGSFCTRRGNGNANCLLPLP